jgi:hypothetical protein
MDMGDGGMDMSGHRAMTDAASAEPNVLDIPVTFPKAGRYKMFVQVKRGENVVTVPFVLQVMNM